VSLPRPFQCASLDSTALRGDKMRRHEFIALLVGAAIACPIAAQAQQGTDISRGEKAQPTNGPLVGFLNSASANR
jgi:hypothetical protein